MIQIKWNEKKLKSFYKKMDLIGSNIKDATKTSLEKGLTGIQKMALDYKRGTKQGILIEITDKDNKLVGRVYTDKQLLPHALFLEFGTGTFAELPHIGTTKTFIKSGFRYWYLPVEKAQRDFGDNRRITINGQDYFIMFAQEPSPFMRPAAFQGRDMAINEVKNGISEFLREVVR